MTVKLRRGYTDGADVAHTILPQLAAWGAAGATLHGRSREQRQAQHASAPLFDAILELKMASRQASEMGQVFAASFETSTSMICRFRFCTWRGLE